MSRQGLCRLLADLRRELSITIVLVTHDLNEARMLADRLVVMDGGRVLQHGSPASIHRAPRNARVAAVVGIYNRFEGQWLGPADRAGWGLMRWTSEDVASTDGPVLTVRDKGKLPPGQALNWVIPGDGITLLDPAAAEPGDFSAAVTQARHLGEITLATLTVAQVPGASLRVTLSGAQRQGLIVGAPVSVRLNLELVHVMPLRPR